MWCLGGSKKNCFSLRVAFLSVSMMSLMMSGLMMSSGDMSPLCATKTSNITFFEMTFLLECFSDLPGQAIQIWTAVHTRWLSKLTCRWQATRGGPVGFSRHPSDLSHSIYFDSCAADAIIKDQTKGKHFHRRDAVNHATDWTSNYCDNTLNA